MQNNARNTYIERIKPYIGTNLIKVIIGQRRVGKSYFIKQIMEIVNKDSPEIQIIYINKEDYLKNVYNTIIVRDVIERHSIRNVIVLRNLTHFIADNTGSLVSGKRISDFLKSQKVNISPALVSEYLAYLCETFFIFKVQRSDLQGKKIFEIGEKYYFNDLGLRNSLVGHKVSDINKLLENIVFMHLKIAGYNVTVGQDRNKEIDFVAQKNNERIYVQVCYRLENESTISRELGNLMKIKDNYQKYVVSMDATSLTTVEGIIHEHIRDFSLRLILF